MGAPGPSSLTSWNDGAAKSQILDFIARVTQQGKPTLFRRQNASRSSIMTAPSGASSPCKYRPFSHSTESRSSPERIRLWRTASLSRRFSIRTSSLMHSFGKQATSSLCSRRIRACRRRNSTPGPTRGSKPKHPKFGRLFKQCTFAPGRASRAPAGQRVQDIHRVRRRHRSDARVLRGELWRSTRERHRLE